MTRVLFVKTGNPEKLRFKAKIYLKAPKSDRVMGFIQSMYIWAGNQKTLQQKKRRWEIWGGKARWRRYGKGKGKGRSARWGGRFCHYLSHSLSFFFFFFFFKLLICDRWLLPRYLVAEFGIKCNVSLLDSH